MSIDGGSELQPGILMSDLDLEQLALSGGVLFSTYASWSYNVCTGVAALSEAHEARATIKRHEVGAPNHGLSLVSHEVMRA